MPGKRTHDAAFVLDEAEEGAFQAPTSKRGRRGRARPGTDRHKGESRARRWCYTSFGKEKPCFNGTPVVYHIVGKEVCPTSGKEHWQGYVVFRSQLRFNQVKTATGGSCHLEVARGTVAENIKYCSKDGQFTEEGVPPAEPSSPGRARIRNQYADAIRRAEAGDFRAIPPRILLQHHRALRAINAERSVSNARPLEPESTPGLWLSGPPGIGKSFRARALGEPLGLFNKNHTKWWDEYNDEPVVLIDEMDHSHRWMSSHLKTWVDLYPFKAETKGGTRTCRPLHTIVTSNYSIQEIWDGDVTLITAIRRRFHEVHVTTREELADVTLPASTRVAVVKEEPIEISSDEE